MTESPVLEYCVFLRPSELHGGDECARLRGGCVKGYEEITYPPVEIL
jgi:hypothetical protein